jgi:hypothetical protein
MSRMMRMKTRRRRQQGALAQLTLACPPQLPCASTTSNTRQAHFGLACRWPWLWTRFTYLISACTAALKPVLAVCDHGMLHEGVELPAFQLVACCLLLPACAPGRLQSLVLDIWQQDQALLGSSRTRVGTAHLPLHLLDTSAPRDQVFDVKVGHTSDESLTVSSPLSQRREPSPGSTVGCAYASAGD